jgi:SSS family solute:Na+ symporter
LDLALSDKLIFFGYIVIILIVGFVIARRRESGASDKESFILAGRKLTLPLFVGSLVATWYGSILGVGEFVYTNGLLAWVSFGLPYYIAGLLFAFLLAKKVRESNVTTIPEQIGKHYGGRAAGISSGIILVITIPAAYLLMLGILIQMFVGWELWVCIVAGAVVSLAFLFTGGFYADILTNFVQFILMFVGFGALLYFTVQTHGSFAGMSEKLPESFLEPLGTSTLQYVLAWYIIAFQTFVDPSFHQRCSAAKSPETAKKGILVSVVFWIIFDFLTLTTGLYARAYYVIDNPLTAYPVLGDAVLPAVWKGLFLTSLIATVMSTLDSYSFISAATIGNDILKKLGGRIGNMSAAFLTKIGLFLTGIIAIILSISVQSVVDLIYYTSSIAVPGLIVPLTLSISRRYSLSGRQAVAIMISSSGISALWIILYFNAGGFFATLEPMFPGILTAVVMGLIMAKRRPEPVK